MCQITLSRHLHWTKWIRTKYLNICKDKQIAPLSPMTWEKKSRAVKPISQMCFYCLFPSSSPSFSFYTISFMCMFFKMLTSFAFFASMPLCLCAQLTQPQTSWIKRSGQDGYTHLIHLYILLIHLLSVSFLGHSEDIIMASFLTTSKSFYSIWFF